MLRRPASKISIHRVDSASGRRKFLKFPYELYENHPYWVPPLRIFEKQLISPRANAFFQHGEIQPFLAVNGEGRVVGRIAGIINGMHLKRYGDGNGFFGFFESENDFEIAEALLDAACGWLKEKGMRGVRGPASPSMNDQSGLLTHGFDRTPFIFMPYNHDYYEMHFTRYGFTRAMEMSAYFINEKYARPERALAALKAVYGYHKDLTVRSADPKRMLDEVRVIVDIHNDAFADNWGHVPLTEAEFLSLAKLFKRFVDPRLVLILELAGKPAGFTVCLPNYNEIIRHLKNGRLLPFGWLNLLLRRRYGGIRNLRSTLTGVLRAYRGHGFDAVLCVEGTKRGLELGYEGCELSWILDHNKVVTNGLESIGAVRDKQYAMFEKRFNA